MDDIHIFSSNDESGFSAVIKRWPYTEDEIGSKPELRIKIRGFLSGMDPVYVNVGSESRPEIPIRSIATKL